MPCDIILDAWENKHTTGCYVTECVFFQGLVCKDISAKVEPHIQHRRALTTPQIMAHAPWATIVQQGASPLFHALLGVFATPQVHLLLTRNIKWCYLSHSQTVSVFHLFISFEIAPYEVFLPPCLRRSDYGELLRLSCRTLLLH